MGLLDATILRMYGQMWRSSSVPFLFPAALNGWHGYPAVRMSQSGTFLSGSFDNSFTSEATGTLGQCCWRILRHQGSMSQKSCGSGDSPAHWKPRAKPPMPEHKSTCLIYLIHLQTGRDLCSKTHQSHNCHDRTGIVQPKSWLHS